MLLVGSVINRSELPRPVQRARMRARSIADAIKEERTPEYQSAMRIDEINIKIDPSRSTLRKVLLRSRGRTRDPRFRGSNSVSARGKRTRPQSNEAISHIAHVRR